VTSASLRFADEHQYFVSEATVYRLLKAHDLITSPACFVVKAADQFHTKTTRVNETGQTDFTYFKIIGWGWMYLSTVPDGFSRYIIAWKLCTNMRAEDVTDTLDLALRASGCDSATVLHKPSPNSVRGSSNRPSNIGACNTASSPPKITPQARPAPRESKPRVVSNVLTTDNLTLLSAKATHDDAFRHCQLRHGEAGARLARRQGHCLCFPRL
jgi:transposase InsO family protein